MWQIWLIIAGILLVGEIVTTGFLIFWFSLGALLAMVVSFFTTNIIIQTAVFVLSSAILIFATKPFIKKFAKNDNSIKTNAFSIIGKKAIVIEDIQSTDTKGQIKINGEVWSAVSSDENIDIPKGTQVEILDIKGVKTVVVPLK